MLKKISRLRKNNLIKINRLKRVIFAEWEQINSSDYIEELTDAMTYNYPVQINYEGSGWRTIQPYGWNTSKNGNINLMCYKDTGEVRSYSVNKIEDVYIDRDSGIAITNNPEMNSDNDLDNLINMQNQDQNQFTEIINNDDYPDDMPSLPEMNTENYSDQEGVYDDELELLLNSDNNNDEYINNEDTIDNNIENDLNQEQENYIDNENTEENNNGENDI